MEVAVIGAGPQGLSLAAHLQLRGVEYRLFGEPMQFWRNAMPRGLRLKSEGFASSLADPTGSFTIGRYCEERGIPYAHVNRPIDVATFVEYGEAFQARLAPALDRRRVALVEQQGRGFRLVLEDGEVLRARRVVVATGLDSYGHMPAELQGLPRDLATHSGEHGPLDQFAGKSVVVVGAGASAADIAAGLVRVGASVRIMTRRCSVKFPEALGQRSLWTKLRTPMTSLGPGWKSVLCVKFPLVFRAMPQRFRNYVVRRYLGAAPAGFLKAELEHTVDVVARAQLTGAQRKGEQLALHYVDREGAAYSLTADHVIAATGYRVDVERLPFLSADLRGRLVCSEGAPVLSANFASSVPGLYMIGPVAAPSFGPMLRFACATHFTARRLGGHLARTAPGKRRWSIRGVQVRRSAGPLDLVNA